MRDIKYRALRTGKVKSFVYGLPFYSHGIGVWSITHSNGWQPTYNDPDSGESTMYTEIDPKTIGRYIGHKDNGDIEVFCGDILKHPRADEPEDLGWVIIWVDYKYCFENVRTKQIIDLDVIYIKLMNIIGNIHETPDLLK